MKKKEHINIRITSKDKQKIIYKSKKMNATITDFILYKCFNEKKEVIK